MFAPCSQLRVFLNYRYATVLAWRSRQEMSPFYRHMFAAAGFPIGEDGTGVSALVKALVVAGTQAQVEKRLRDLIASGLDELVLMLVPVADEARE